MTDKSESIRAEHARPLWAPWRIEYIKKQDEDRCFLCDNIVDDGPEKDLLIARGETAYLIMNGFPYNSGHVLIAPNRHVADLCDLTADERAEINLGAAAGAGVRDHVHGHLVPRWIGDTNFMPVIGNVRVVPQALAETAKLFRDAWERSA